LLALFTFSLVFTACGDDDEAPSYELSLFLGEWKLTNSTDPDYKSCENDPPILTITENKLDVAVIDTSNGCNAGSASLDYTFTGQAFTTTVFGFEVVYNIQSASETEFSWKDNAAGYTETYVKVN
ncbi:hypothetical protein, partial [Fulvivirga aurantia]|uniref:hypothetical protein n=1 Tax=Fulvivirga aurantia TaxID=2529383 RepID=UPI001CA3FC29